ncbi:MAG: hypothetical protein H0X61_08135 [Acidimicrobiia bacterium]|jgi:hypothetical protein|nr:hypothetical protein [Acidimicrobiia bacterium]MDQ3389968.1 hypothetical protein [Actinomycetota bacterium]
MTEQTERPSADLQDAVITEALDVIDQALAKMFQRELISSGEVADVLLDVRTALTTTSVVQVSHEPPAPTPA